MPRPSTRAVAVAALLAVLATPSTSSALGGAAETASTPTPTCAAGEVLARAGETAEAKKTYVGVLQRDPGAACAANALIKLNAPPAAEKTAHDEAKTAQKECETGKKLLQAGRVDEAIKAFEAALKANPKNGCAKHQLEGAPPSDATELMDDISGSLPDVLLGVGLVLLGFFLFLLLGHLRPIGRRFRRIWGIRAILKPRLSFADVSQDAVEGKPGPPLNARIKQRLTRMRDEALKDRLREYDLDFGRPREEFADLVSGEPALKSALEKASDVSDQTKVVAALLNIAYTVLPIPRLEIGITLEPPSATGAAATVQLLQNAKLEGATTLRGPAPAKAGENPKAPDYLPLADPAAVWVQFEAARALKGAPPDAAETESHTLVVEGLDLFNRGDLEGARSRYENAIRIDHRNWAAYVCLATAEARLGSDFERSIKRILEGLEGMQRAGA